MSYVKWKKNNKRYKLKYHILILFLIFSTDTFLCNTNIQPFWRYASWGVICFGVVFFVWSNRKKTEKGVVELFLIYGVLIISMIISQDIAGGYIFKAVLLTFGFYLTRNMSFNEFRDCFIFWMKVIAINSLIGLLLSKYIINCSCFPILSNGLYQVKVFGLTNISIENDWTAAGTELFRNYGPFWEPGVYQIYLMVAIIFSIFTKNKINTFEVLLFSLTVATTFSTTGYICIVLIFTAFFLQKKYSRFKLFLCFGGVIAITCFLNSPHLMDFVFSKLSGKGASVASFNARWYSVWSNLYVAFEHPLGVGPHGLENEIVGFLETFDIKGYFTNVNMLTEQFALYGVPFGIYYIFKLFISANRYIASNLCVKIVVFIVLVLELFSEPLVYSLLFSTIIFYDKGKKRGSAIIDENSLVV